MLHLYMNTFQRKPAARLKYWLDDARNDNIPPMEAILLPNKSFWCFTSIMSFYLSKILNVGFNLKHFHIEVLLVLLKYTGSKYFFHHCCVTDVIKLVPLWQGGTLKYLRSSVQWVLFLLLWDTLLISLYFLYFSVLKG